MVQFAGVRIGGMSGIYKGKDYMKGKHWHSVSLKKPLPRKVHLFQNLV